MEASMISRSACAFRRCVSYAPERVYLRQRNEHLTGIVDFRFQESCVYSEGSRKVVVIVGEILDQVPRTLRTITSSGIGLALFVAPSRGFSCLLVSSVLKQIMAETLMNA